MTSVSLAGIGFVNEDPVRAGAQELVACLGAAELPNVRWSPTPRWAGIPFKDRRILASGDVMAAEAAGLAMLDSGLEAAGLLEDMACIVFNTGKGSRAQERRQVRMGFRTSEHRPDMAALIAAINAGTAIVDPLVLLHDLDNTTLWWLCKRYPAGSLNLHICQPNAPAYYALLEAVQSIAHGECNVCLVGGYQTVDMSAVHVRYLGGPALEDEDEQLAGGAAFAVLRRAAPGQRSYGKLVVSAAGTKGGESPSGRAGPLGAGAPALRPMLDLVIAALRPNQKRCPTVLSDPEAPSAPPITFVSEAR